MVEAGIFLFLLNNSADKADFLSGGYRIMTLRDAFFKGNHRMFWGKG